MLVGVIGAGYVGLVTAAGLAARGHTVRVGESAAERVSLLSDGFVPFFEPNLAPLVRAGVERGHLSFHVDNLDAVAECRVVFLALPTPPNGDGSADTRIVEAVAHEIALAVEPDAVLVLKSTVPVGTTQRVQDIVIGAGGSSPVVANPEFLREGSSVADFDRPSRIVIGSHDRAAVEVMLDLYADFDTNVVVTDPSSAELIKYASNAYLATRISFANELARLCEAAGADVAHVLHGVGADPRIGHGYFQPGPGYGGSCLPKDTRGLLATARDLGSDLLLVQAAVEANLRQLDHSLAKIRSAADGDLEGKNVAFWGLAFKADTDDIRESPALALAMEVAAAGASVTAYDPMAAPVPDSIRRVGSAAEATKDADVLVVATEWDEFRYVDLAEVRHAMRTRAIVDLRSVLDSDGVALNDFAHVGFRRAG